MKRCNQCGAENVYECKLCVSCGKNLYEKTDLDNKKESMGFPAILLSVILLAIGLFSLITGLINLLGG